MDVFKFINKRGEICTFRVYKDEFQRAIKKELFNHQTFIKKERNYSYKTYTYADGTTVPYKEIVTALFDKPVIPLKPNMFARDRELLATVKNGDKLDVTKSKYMLFEPKNGDDIIEKSFVVRFANGKRPQGIQSILTRDKNFNIKEKKTAWQRNDGKVFDIKTDLFYHSLPYEENFFKQDVVISLKREMGLQDYNIRLRPVHRGYNPAPGAVNNMGAYNHPKKLYTYNIDNPLLKERKNFAGVTGHELTHAFQNKEIELLEQGLLKGARKDAAETYKKEFSNYIKYSSEDSSQQSKYLEQTIEAKANDFKKFIRKYYTQNIKNIYNTYVEGIIPPQAGIFKPVNPGKLNKI